MLGVEVARISNIKKKKVWTNSGRSFVNMKVQPDSLFFSLLPHVLVVNLEAFWGSVLPIKIPVIKDLTRVLD